MKTFFKSKNTSTTDHTWVKDFVDYSSMPIFRGNNSGTILYCNQSFAKSLAYLSKSDLQNINLRSNLFVDSDSWDYLIELLKKNDRIEKYKAELVQKDGNKVSFEISVRSVKDDDGELQYFEGVLLEKDDKENYVEKEKYEELLTELEELKRKEEATASEATKAIYTKNVKSQYLASMSHEIKTPINAISGFLTLIEQDLFEDENELHEFAHNAKTATDSLLEIINNVLDISRLEAGGLELDEVEFDLAQEVEKAKTIAMPASGKNGIVISSKIDSKLNFNLVGDPIRYRQVLVNIITNSVKYTESGSIEVFVELEKERELSCVIKTTVKDTGIGIPEDKLPLLFKPYTQVKNKKWNKQDGSGLGLMICKELVRLMDGEITIKSKEGLGTVVEFTTTMKLSKAISSYNNKQTAKVEKTIHNKKNESSVIEKKVSSRSEEPLRLLNFDENENPNAKKILLVEDNPISQKVEMKLLKESGYNVKAVSNGYDAIEAVKIGNFDLVLMDVEMVGMDGLESTQRIRALAPPMSKIPIIAVTAHSSMKDREKCLASGMDDYIAKPININFMKMTIDHWIARGIDI